MQIRGTKNKIIFVACAVVAVTCLMGTSFADTTSSSNYKATETHFGPGSSLQSCSNSYCSKISIGDSVVGSSESSNYSNYSASFGSNTSDQPLLEVITEGGVENLGVLDVDHTATATRIVKVRSYLSHGYIIQIAGGAPNQGTHALKAISEPSTSHAGAEQFGLNLVANTAPNIGANPEQVPSTSTSFGYATDDYATANLFKYLEGDIVARSDHSSGETDYTVSIIINVSNSTPSGRYNGSFSAVVVPIY